MDPPAGIWVAAKGLFVAFSTSGTGATYCPRTGNAAGKSGYAVAIQTVKTLPVQKFTVWLLFYILLLHWEKWQFPGRHIGLWRDEKRNRIYIEVTIIIEDFIQALHIARDYGQYSIHHLPSGLDWTVSDYLPPPVLGPARPNAAGRYSGKTAHRKAAPE